MRRLIAILLISVIMLVGCQGSLAEAVQIECKLATAVDWSAEEWFETAESRALLTMLFLFEMGTDNTIPIDKYSVSDSLVCKNENILSIAVCGDDDSIMIFYAPEMSYASYLVMEKYTIDVLENSMNLIYPEVKLNTSEALATALDLIGTMYNN